MRTTVGMTFRIDIYHMTKEEIYNFIQKHKLGVLASIRTPHR